MLCSLLNPPITKSYCQKPPWFVSSSPACSSFPTKPLYTACFVSPFSAEQLSWNHCHNFCGYRLHSSGYGILPKCLQFTHSHLIPPHTCFFFILPGLGITEQAGKHRQLHTAQRGIPERMCDSSPDCFHPSSALPDGQNPE